MAAKHHYIVSILNTSFKRLEEVKCNLKTVLTRNEAKKYLINEEILHFKCDKLISVTPINVDDYGYISFGHTRRVKQ